MKKAFTLIELVFVIIVVAILAGSIKLSFFNNSLNVAADQLISHIRYTQSLALKDDKFQPFPLDDSKTEVNRSKYWFKQWWQIRFSKSDGHYWYEIFTDVPSEYKTKNFDAQANLPTSAWEISIAKNPLNNKLMIGHCGEDQYPDCSKTDNKLDLTKKYGIQDIEFENFYSYSRRLVFDNFGNIFLREGKDGDAGDTNPVDKDKRIALDKNATIKLCLDDDCSDLSPKRCIKIVITPNGFIKKTNCQ